MSRGKHAEQAARRQSAAETAEQLGTYQRAVARLTAENEQLRTEAAAATKQARADVRAMRLQLSAGTSDRVAALEFVLRQARDERDRARVALARVIEARERFVVRVGDLLQRELGWTRLETLEFVATVLPEFADRPDKVTLTDVRPQAKLDRRARHAIETARGMRRS